MGWQMANNERTGLIIDIFILIIFLSIFFIGNNFWLPPGINFRYTLASGMMGIGLIGTITSISRILDYYK